METITTKQLALLLGFIDSLGKLDVNDWIAICQAQSDLDIPLTKAENK